jgi:hypothetical protein
MKKKKGKFMACPALAERLGFEPRVTQKSHNGFRDRPIQPLWHLSVRARHQVAWRDYNKETGFLQLPYRNVNQSGKIPPQSSSKSKQGQG